LAGPNYSSASKNNSQSDPRVFNRFGGLREGVNMQIGKGGID